jgi:hypothetical protein
LFNPPLSQSAHRARDVDMAKVHAPIVANRLRRVR